MKTRLNTCKSKLNHLLLVKWHKHTKGRDQLLSTVVLTSVAEPLKLFNFSSGFSLKHLISDPL